MAFTVPVVFARSAGAGGVMIPGQESAHRAVAAVASGGLDLTCLAARTASGQVRTLIEFRLTEWRLLGIARDVYLVAGELIANAVEHTPDEEIRIRFTQEPGSVLLAVWDTSDQMPVVRPVKELTLEDIEPDPHALDPGHEDGTGGWGLPIVQALASECGVQATRPHGKWVFARLATRGAHRGGVCGG